MDPNLHFPNQTAIAAQPQMQSCFKCRWEGRTFLTACPRCGKGLFSQTNVRWRGVALIILGLFLSGLMSAVTIFVTVFLMTAAKDPRSNAQFRGSESMLLLIYLVFGALIAGGVTAAIGGVWQAVFGRRNMFLMWFCAAFMLVALFAGTVFRGVAE